jgi:hypothetical protein
MKLATVNADEDLDGDGDIMDEEPGHISHMAGMLYGRESTGLADSITMRRLKYRASSIDWHRFLQFPDPSMPAQH